MGRTSAPINKYGESITFVTRNRGKKGITLNIASAKGQQIARDLAKLVDLVISNYSPGVMERHGLGYEELAKLNPKLVYAVISGYGQAGPRASENALDVIVQATGGLMDLNGSPDGPPTKVGPSIGDISGGLYTAIAIVGALYYASRTGQGQMIDISLQDCVFAVASLDLGGPYFMLNQIPKRTGNHHPRTVPFGAYPAKDGMVMIAMTGGGWEPLLKLIGREDLIDDKRYTEPMFRLQHMNEIIAFIEAWTKTKTQDEILNALKNIKVPCSPVPTFVEVCHDPQILLREMIVEVEQPLSGKWRLPGSVLKMSKNESHLREPAPALGEHNYEVYSRMLGYSESEVKKLAAEGVI